MSITTVHDKRFVDSTHSKSGLEFVWIGFVSGISENRTATDAIFARTGTKLDSCLADAPAKAAIAIGVNYDIITTAIASNALIDWTWDANIYPIIFAFQKIF